MHTIYRSCLDKVWQKWHLGNSPLDLAQPGDAVWKVPVVLLLTAATDYVGKNPQNHKEGNRSSSRRLCNKETTR